jgi:hypothetical protein
VIASPDASLLPRAATPKHYLRHRQIARAMPPRAPRRAAEQFDWQSTTDGQIAIFRSVSNR